MSCGFPAENVNGRSRALPDEFGSHAFQLRDHLVVLGKNSRVVFRVDLFSIGNDIKDASAALDQLALDSGCCPHCIRQTDGFGGVVSLDAVRDGNVHWVSFAKVS